MTLAGTYRVAAATLTGLIVALCAAAPAWAHGGANTPAVPADYRVKVTTIDNPLPGITLRVVEAGERLELTNQSAAGVEVLGFANEPFLRVGRDGVYANTASPTYQHDETRKISAEPPGASATPQWHRLSTATVWRWHDHRTHAATRTTPPAVAAEPDRFHHVSDWAVQLRSGEQMSTVHGAVDWLPPPPAARWWWGCLLLAGALMALGWFTAATARWPTRVLAAALLGAAVGAAAYCAARTTDATPGGEFGAAWLGRLIVDQTWPALTAVAALVCASWALVSRPDRDSRAFAIGISAAATALMGLVNGPVLHHAVAPVPGGGAWARVAVAAAIALSVGAAGGTILRLNAILRIERAKQAPATTNAAAG